MKFVATVLLGFGLLPFATATAQSDTQCAQLLTPKTSTLPQVYLTSKAPKKVAVKQGPFLSTEDADLERARTLILFEDFKWLSDLSRRVLSERQRQSITRALDELKASGQESHFLKRLISSRFHYRQELMPVSRVLTQPKYTVMSTSPHKTVVDYIEKTWKDLARLTPTHTTSSLIPVPFPILIPGSRFQEAYYWDSYFAASSLIKTGRAELVRMQIENFLYLIETYGLVPNGLRDYYLSRSQPPILSQLIREMVDEDLKVQSRRGKSLRWLRDRALPLLVRDYENFWMNPKKRFDSVTGLNHHYDDLQTPRPERFSLDKEEELGVTYRDVRAAAESGKDFTATFGGQATEIAPVLLNSLLYQTELNIAHFATLTAQSVLSETYHKKAERRKAQMQRYMWDEETGAFRDYHFEKGQMPYLTADLFAALWSGLASKAQAGDIVNVLRRLERTGGIVASEIHSGHQWDAPYGWAPHQYIAVEGLKAYGYEDHAQRIARKWVTMIDQAFKEKPALLEKMDVEQARAPFETGEKYLTQEGFLWTNGVYLHLLVDHLGVELLPLNKVRR